MDMLDIRFLFSREKTIKRLQNAKPLPTVVMDEVFSHRPQLAEDTVSVEDVALAVRSTPLIQRGGASLAMGPTGGSLSGYEPLSISLNVFISAADINKLKNYDPQGLEAWATNKTESLRRTIRNTSEGIAAQAVSGKIEWPVQIAGGGTDMYTVEWGAPLTVAPAKLFDAGGASLLDVVKTLKNMRKAMRRKGFGGAKMKVWAGEDAFDAILTLAMAYEGDQLKVEIGDERIRIGTTDIVLRNEEYPHPTQKGTWVPIMNSKALRMIDPAGGHQMPYCALDDLDAKLAPLPLFVKPIKKDDPSGYKLVAQSKPFPVPNMEAITECLVVS